MSIICYATTVEGNVKATYFDEIVVPVISFLVIAAGCIGLLGFLYDPTLEPGNIVALLASIIALPGGYLLAKFKHLGWLMSLTVLAMSELLVLGTHVTVNRSLDPVFFFVFTLYYCGQIYYLIIKRDLFAFPTFHPRGRKPF